MTKYAQKTEVPVAKSRAEIETILQRYGADQFMSGWGTNTAIVGFRMNGRQVKFLLPLPDPEDETFRYTAHKNRYQRTKRSAEARGKAWEQACRQRWRALALVIKAKLEAVESGITEFDDEFMAHIVLPDGQTVGNIMKPQIAEAYTAGTMPAMLPDYSKGAQ